MIATSSHDGDVVAYFWNAYFEWRISHALNDTCMLELVAAIRAEINIGKLSGVEVARLQKLARMIEVQLAAEHSDCRAAWKSFRQLYSANVTIDAPLLPAISGSTVEIEPPSSILISKSVDWLKAPATT